MTVYLLHIHRNVCEFCHTEERWSNLYQCDEMVGTRYPKLTPARSIPDYAPLTTLNLPANTIPICARCAPGRDGIRNANTYADWQATLQRKAEAERKATLDAASKAAKEPKSIDHLL